MKIRLASDITTDSIVDGPGIRTVVWAQGCNHNCFNCHNKETHSFTSGTLYNIDDIAYKINNTPLQDGLTLSGGDPFFQPKEFVELLDKVKVKNIWAYTGFLYEDIINNKEMSTLLKKIDVLVDGLYIDSLRDISLQYKGSSNQRIIDVKKSLKENKVILLNL